MQLYRFHVNFESGEVVPVIIVAATDEKAFDSVEVELEKFYLKVPPIADIELHEKKRIHGYAGYVMTGRNLP